MLTEAEPVLSVYISFGDVRLKTFINYMMKKSLISRTARYYELGYFKLSRVICDFHMTSCLTELLVNWGGLALGYTL